jgi:hypothetical protein
MFFLPAAIFTGAGDITWGDTLHNWLFAGLGNFVGAAIFVAGAYWYLYARPEGDEDPGRPGGPWARSANGERDGAHTGPEPVGSSAQQSG